MEITKLAVERIEGGKLVTVQARFLGNEELTGDDLVKLTDQISEAAALGRVPAAGEPAPSSRRRRSSATETAGSSPATPTETASPRRSRGGSEGAEPPAAQPPADASSASASDGRRRRTEPASDQAPAEGQRRRRAEPTPAAVEPPKPLTEGDLVKAASAAHATLHKKFGGDAGAMILTEIEKFDNAKGFICESVGEIAEADRRKFLDALDALVAANK